MDHGFGWQLAACQGARYGAAEFLRGHVKACRLDFLLRRAASREDSEDSGEDMQMCVWENANSVLLLLAGKPAETSHGAHGFPPVILRGSFVRSFFYSLICLWCEGLGIYFFDFFFICCSGFACMHGAKSGRSFERGVGLTDDFDEFD